jgi:hypothetical protein
LGASHAFGEADARDWLFGQITTALGGQD